MTHPEMERHRKYIAERICKASIQISSISDSNLIELLAEVWWRYSIEFEKRMALTERVEALEKQMGKEWKQAEKELPLRDKPLTDKEKLETALKTLEYIYTGSKETYAQAMASWAINKIRQ
jgi:hypothetical protein